MTIFVMRADTDGDDTPIKLLDEKSPEVHRSDGAKRCF
jgi:hypothetical protein